MEQVNGKKMKHEFLNDVKKLKNDKKEQKVKLYEQPIGDENFWKELEQERKILKFNKSGKYNVKFDEKYQKFLDYLHSESDVRNISVGDIVDGYIMSINKREMVVNINYKDSVYVTLKPSDYKIAQNFAVGDKISIVITNILEPYELKGSFSELLKMNIKRLVKEYFENNIAIEGVVKEMIPAGFLVEVEINNIPLITFMPNILSSVNKLTDEQNKELVGKKINVMFETIQQEEGLYVVSRRKYLESLIEIKVNEVRKEISENPYKIYDGIVTGTIDFGVFVEFNECLTGMIHKCNIDPDWQDRIHEIKAGTPIQFYVREVTKNNKLILTQIYRETLWDSIKEGMELEGVIKSINNNIILLQLDEETMGAAKVENNENLSKYNIGDKIKVKVSHFYRDDRKIFLNII